MSLKYSPVCNFGKKIVPFKLFSATNEEINLENCLGEKGTLVMFICNHCPYVKAIIKDIVGTVDELKKIGINSIAIMPNDYEKYPEDNPLNMIKFSEKYNLRFPYLIDSEQIVTKRYEAICTPEFFGYNCHSELQYRGRLTELNNLKKVNGKNELLIAMKLIAEKNTGPKDQNPSMGCSIKWK
tara:strand:+ start:732 stop:1280 length:549 start_codon:yes stop_codon:yes gene_type:complete